MPRILLLVASLLLGACAAHTPVPQTLPALVAPLPLSLQIQREKAQVRQDWLLVVQREGSALRWSLMDPLGIPQARQLLDAGQWRNDGLLPPNTEARELFAALLFALTRADALQAYPAGSWQQESDERRRLAPDWTIDYHGPVDFTLGKTGLNYRIRALNLEESD
ncbi:hypothetical protein OF113_02895 [Ectopseudomonas chengduensis]|jgi:hypothetical protein|nr:MULTISPECIES: hypothetical protein [Pseudomonas]KJU76050.1 lipoprotein [Pseudomonas oleovorans]MBJ7546512.1 hypothetical protein [Pseudomonas sp. OA3]MDZ4191406.1 hypothetical protein [Pseudomonas sp.]UZT79017.1 hypothetical protein OF113_02895 [Pseudomonas chengduensis]